MSNVGELTKVLHASVGDNNDIADTARATIDRECTRLILSRLWFRLIEERKDSIGEAHAQTLEWAINPPTSNVAWSDLGEWLRSGSDIYWICGKPGSGKSTLMKFLYDHPQVMRSLQQWAGDRKLTVAHSFLWNLGHPDQNSQRGLAQGLLYHVLKENQALIPIVLPHMWQEVQNGSLQPAPPSDTELGRAFQLLGRASTNGAYTFFIDGLDEFTGDYRKGIEFLQSITASPNVKILLSSRPIDTFITAFSTKPRLNLEDLTTHDIRLYVDDKIRQHPHAIEETYLHADTVDRLAGDLREKAQGIFLWVVLACRALIGGLDAYDTAEELQSRVDELPKGLFDLFSHILDNIPTRSLHQAAQLLRICYQSRLLQLSDQISAIALSWADQGGMKTGSLARFTPLSPGQAEDKCRILEGRLRSRCRGLLEVHSATRKDLSASYRFPGDRSVDFMHRTVFEFLNTPGVWELKCLRMPDPEFNPAVILSYMSCYLLCLQQSPVSIDADLALQSIGYMWYIQHDSPSELTQALSRLADAFLNQNIDTQRVSSADEGDFIVQFPENGTLVFNDFEGDLPLDCAAMLLAVEADLPSAVHEEDVAAFNRSKKLYLRDTAKNPNLLYHAFRKPLLSSIDGFRPLLNQKSAYPSVALVDTLLRAGCDPNEGIPGFGGATTTPWQIWQEFSFAKSNTSEQAAQVAEITVLMIRAGATLGTHNPDRLAVQSTVHDRRAILVATTGVWLALPPSERDVGCEEKINDFCNEILRAVEVSQNTVQTLTEQPRADLLSIPLNLVGGFST